MSGQYHITIPVEIMLQELVAEAKDLYPEKPAVIPSHVAQRINAISMDGLRSGLIVRMIIGKHDLHKAGNVISIRHVPVVVLNALPQIVYEDNDKGRFFFVKDDVSNRRVYTIDALHMMGT